MNVWYFCDFQGLLGILLHKNTGCTFGLLSVGKDLPAPPFWNFGAIS